MRAKQPITEYDCHGCLVQLVKDKGAYWAQVSNGDSWAYRAGPRSCPQEALCCGEIEVLKVGIKKMLRPALVLNVRGRKVGQEIILAHNIDALEILQADAIGSMMTDLFVGQTERFHNLMQGLRRGAVSRQELILRNFVGEDIPVYLECRPLISAISLTPLACCLFDLI